MENIFLHLYSNIEVNLGLKKLESGGIDRLNVSKNFAVLILIYSSQCLNEHPEPLKMSFESIIT